MLNRNPFSGTSYAWNELHPKPRFEIDRERPNKKEDPIVFKMPMMKAVRTRYGNYYIYDFDEHGIYWLLIGAEYLHSKV